MLGNTIYLPGSTVNINDIGDQPTNRSEPGMTLVCVTTHINTACCRKSDNGGIGPLGDLIDPNEGSVTPLNMAVNNTLFNVRYTQQMRLGSRGSPTGPLGEYTCLVPDMNGDNVIALITLSSKLIIYSI